MDDHRSSYWTMKVTVDEFLDKFHGVMSGLDREDERRNLFTLEDSPASLMEYPQFEGKDSQCYF